MLFVDNGDVIHQNGGALYYKVIQDDGSGGTNELVGDTLYNGGEDVYRIPAPPGTFLWKIHSEVCDSAGGAGDCLSSQNYEHTTTFPTRFLLRSRL